MSENFFENFNTDPNNGQKESLTETPEAPQQNASADFTREENREPEAVLTSDRAETAEPETVIPSDREETQEPYAFSAFETAETRQTEDAMKFSEAYPRQDAQDAQRTAYPDIYSDRTSYGSTVQSNPYSNPYRQPEAPVRETPAYNDGFYHQSFSGQSNGANVNYTRPVQQTAQQPYTAQPQPRYQQTTPPRPAKPERKKSGMSKGAVAILLAVCVLISGAAGFGGSMLASKLNQSKYMTTDNSTMIIHKVDAEAQVAGTEALVDKTTEEITNEVADTVVEITTEVMQTSSFYGQYIAQGAGSGVIISDDGYILTNNHVIDGASSIKVTTRSGETYDATLKGVDSKIDIALLKIEATGLPTAVFGDSDTLKVGSKAVIIGNPLGTLGGSVTEGIISALDRSIDIDGKTMHLMQTDAAINPGNSGGGMFNGQGELSGIVVAKSSSEEIDNIGFVIPINNVLDILGDLKEYGYVRGRADTGMEFIDLTNQMYAYYYYGNNAAGVYISSVDSGSNAETAGFRKGDRVVSVDGKEITSADDITAIIAEKSAGDTVTFELNRSGSTGKLELTLEEDVPSVNTNSNNNNNSNNSDDNGFGGYDPFGGLFGGR